jgi:polyhydroxybutyrate depolymerase
MVGGIFVAVLLAVPSGVVLAQSADPSSKLPTEVAARRAVPSAGCSSAAAGPADAAPTDDTGSLEVNGQERTWRIHIPVAHNGVTPVPLVILLHGLGEDAGIIRNFTSTGLPDQAGFVVVAPLGSGIVTRWMWDLGVSEYDLSTVNPDIAFIEALVDHLGSTLCLDDARIFAAGYSNGAIGVSALGCVLEDRIAAIAGVAALTDFGEACHIDRPVPVLGIHGTDDQYVLYEGGWGRGIEDFTMEDFVSFADQPITSWPGFQASIPERAAGLATRNDCQPGSTASTIAEDVESRAWDCPAGADVELITIHGGGHAWPTLQIDGATAIWEFFSRQSLPE